MLAVAAAFAVAFSPTSTPRLAVQQRANGVSMIDKNVKIPSKMVWVPMVPASECPPGSIVSGFRYGVEVAIANTGKGLYAFSNKMPPTGQPTTFAEIDGNFIVEPVSGTKYDLKTGKQTGTWCPSPIGKLLIGRVTQPQNLEKYEVRKSGNKIEAKININAKAQFEQKYWRGILDAQGKVDGGYY